MSKDEVEGRPRTTAASRALHRRPPRRRGAARRPCRTTRPSPGADPARRGAAAPGRRAGRRCRPPALPRAPGHGAGDRRLPASDLAWLDMKTNTLDIVIGPIETYEDKLFGYKAAAEAYVLLKDKEWSSGSRATRRMLPALQRGLPVPDAVQARRGPAPTPTSTPTTPCTTPATRMPARRRSPSTCPTTKRCSSRRAPAGCSSRT